MTTAAFIITVLVGGTLGWLCRGRRGLALGLSVLASAACFGMASWLKGQSEEILVQWLRSQLGFQVLTYTLGFLLPCAGGAAVAEALYRNAHRKEGR